MSDFYVDLQDRTDKELIAECVELDELRDNEKDTTRLNDLTKQIMERMDIIYKRMQEATQ